MRKITLLALAVLMMVGCKYEDRQTKEVDGVIIVTIDSCEYVRCVTYYGYTVYCHKGNCRFCKERRKKEMKKLVEQLKEK